MKEQPSSSYCTSRFETVRRHSRVVQIGSVPVGGHHPIVVQSMTTTPTQDVDATVRQCIQLAEAGCEVIRITAQNNKAAEALKDIRSRFSKEGFPDVPLVADIHFLPSAAMTAVQYVEKVRINPGNYADKKKFQQKEYSENEYTEELDRLHEAFSPIVLRCKELGKAMRIGTNHGSLSDRIMNRYGDTPLGMCESALEFLRIAESHGYKDIILSMKASNPKVMIQAYRLMVAKMTEENMHYPLHLGVTEAGDGDDARIKSAIGIGSLLLDGLGDTIRVSLTEDPVYEIPVAQSLVKLVGKLHREAARRTLPDDIEPYTYKRQAISPLILSTNLKLGPLEPPRVIHNHPIPEVEGSTDDWLDNLAELQDRLKEAKIEGLLLSPTEKNLPLVEKLNKAIHKVVPFLILDTNYLNLKYLDSSENLTQPGDYWLNRFTNKEQWIAFKSIAERNSRRIILDIDPESLAALTAEEIQSNGEPVIITLSNPDWNKTHATGAYRQLSEVVRSLGAKNPIWIRHTSAGLIDDSKNGFGETLLDASILMGSLLCDGIGDLVSIETVDNPDQSITLAYNILQGTRNRSTKTEYVACPSCGRTLFDLQTTTQRIRSATGHLKGVTIAVMGCIVNGPGEMADADFGYVGGAPGKINLYVGKECVQFHIPAENAVDALIDLIRQHDKWVEPEPVESA